jgi:hypothetical protein
MPRAIPRSAPRHLPTIDGRAPEPAQPLIPREPVCADGGLHRSRWWGSQRGLCGIAGCLADRPRGCGAQRLRGPACVSKINGAGRVDGRTVLSSGGARSHREQAISVHAQVPSGWHVQVLQPSRAGWVFPSWQGRSQSILLHDQVPAPTLESTLPQAAVSQEVRMSPLAADLRRTFDLAPGRARGARQAHHTALQDLLPGRLGTKASRSCSS